MKRIFAALGIFALSLTLINCNKDDGDDGYTVTPLRDRNEVYTENTQALEEYLKNNYIIESGESITFDSITSPSYKNQPTIWNDPRLKSIELTSDNLVLTPVSTDSYDPYTGQMTQIISRIEYKKPVDSLKYKVYYLNINQGLGETSLTIDSTYVKTKVTNLKNEVVNAPLQGSYYSYPRTITEISGEAPTPVQLTTGERQLLTLVKTATGIRLNSDGSLIYDQGSAGRIIGFFPSGMYLFNNSSFGGKLQAYQPVISDITVINKIERDHDRDGIPSNKEVEPSKIGGLLTLQDYFSYTTSGHEYTPNFLNIDDDDDGVPTKFEIQYKAADGSLKYYSYDAPELKIYSNIPNYLDKNIRPYFVDNEWVWETDKVDEK